MPAFDSGFKIVARISGRRLAELARIPVDEWTPVVSEVQMAERFADRAFRARRGRERFIVYLEAYTFWRKEAPWNLLAKSGLLSERERLPTVCLVFILRPRGYKPQHGQFKLTVKGETTQFVRLHEVCLWEVEPEPWWEGAPGLMALYPLCRHRRPAKQAISYAASAITAATPDTIVRADLLTTLAIFGKLVYQQVDIVGLIGREHMKESPLYEEIKDEGRIEGRIEGRLETGQADVLAVLEERFGDETAAQFSDVVHAVTKLDELNRLHRLAVRCPSIKEFQRGLRAR
jgi:hypothetical protein